MIAESLGPSVIIVFGALLVPFIRGTARSLYMLALPVIAFLQLLGLPPGYHGVFELYGYHIVPLRVDDLSFTFGVIFHIAAFMTVLYSLHVRDTMQHVATLVYAGSAIGAVFAGDFLTMFLYWEGTAIASVFLIWARRTERAYHVGMRYLMIQIGSGLLLMAGIVLFAHDNNAVTFEYMGLVSTATWLIFLSFAVKAAFPLLHNWLQDSYPEATVTGTVVLSIFTTKLAIYALVRGFPGTDILIPIGLVMAVFPLVYAFIENDLRRSMSYILNNQLGFMVCAVGIGTPLALSGAVAHAFAHILYEGLLFMALGAVLFRTGTIKATSLGGLGPAMPWTTLFWYVGAASIAAFPLFSGFATKSLILSAAGHDGHAWAFGILTFASAGVFLVTGLHLPRLAFFGSEREEHKIAEAPSNMLAAMAFAAVGCIALGVLPGPLYAILPFETNYDAYTTSHVVTQIQLLAFTALAYAILLRIGLVPEPRSTINLDFDVVYRKLLPKAWRALGRQYVVTRDAIRGLGERRFERFIATVYRAHGPQGALARTWPTGSTVLWVAALLAVSLILYYI